MGFAYFNENVGYNGQDLHFIRNGRDFDLSKFFNATGSFVATYRRPAFWSSDTYQNINLNSSTGIINATEYTGGDKVTNFIITVEINQVTGTGSILLARAKIRINIHDRIQCIWLTPGALSIRKLINSVRFGVLAKFSDNVVGDISWHYDFTFTVSPSTSIPAIPSDLLMIAPTPSYNRIKINNEASFPATLQTYNKCVLLTPPAYILNSSGSSGAVDPIYGAIQTRPDGVLNPIYTNNNSDSSDTLNLLFLNDGFNEEEDNEAFIDMVTGFKEHLSSYHSEPWSLINYNHSINYWSYFLDSNERNGSIHGDCININPASPAPIVMPIYNFVEACDQVIGNLTTSQMTGDPVTVQTSGELRGTEVHPTQYYPRRWNNFDYFTRNPQNNAIAVGTIPGYSNTVLHTWSPAFKNMIESIAEFSGLPGYGTRPFSPSFFSQPVGSEAKTLNLFTLIKLVGYPSYEDSDLSKTVATKVSEWVSANFISSTSSPKIKYGSDATGSSSDFYLFDFVFRLWQKLGPRIALEYRDTALGVYRGYATFKPENDSPEELLSINFTKFSDKIAFNIFINKISSTSINLGALFFDNNGTAILKDDSYSTKYLDYSGNTINEKQLKNGNNIIILSKTHKGRVSGVNITYAPPTVAHTIITEHYSIVPITPKDSVYIECTKSAITIDGNSISKIIINDLAIDDLTLQVKDSALHELSHNYLKDEYATNYNNIDFLSLTENEQREITLRLRNSNIQTKYDIGNSVDNIKWLWPRISGIAIAETHLTHTSGDIYKFIYNKSSGCDFQVHNTVLLRKRDLFDKVYHRFKIDAIISANELHLQLISSPITDEDLIDLFILIYPVWTDGTETEYYQLVHPSIKTLMTNTGTLRPLVSTDAGDYAIQQPYSSFNFSPTIYKDTPAAKRPYIIGLYAGGDESYSSDVYHSSGFCVMRGTEHPPTESPQANEFCFVCKYILTDKIDPLMHPSVNNSYPTP